jgi:hypothetical protein
MGALIQFIGIGADLMASNDNEFDETKVEAMRPNRLTLKEF